MLKKKIPIMFSGRKMTLKSIYKVNSNEIIGKGEYAGRHLSLTERFENRKERDERFEVLTDVLDRQKNSKAVL
jgi:hypothetical protein